MRVSLLSLNNLPMLNVSVFILNHRQRNVESSELYFMLS